MTLNYIVNCDHSIFHKFFQHNLYYFVNNAMNIVFRVFHSDAFHQKHLNVVESHDKPDTNWQVSFLTWCNHQKFAAIKTGSGAITYHREKKSWKVSCRSILLTATLQNKMRQNLNRNISFQEIVVFSKINLLFSSYFLLLYHIVFIWQ